MNLAREAVALPRSLVNELLKQAQGAPNSEICGLVGARNGTLSVYPVANVARDSAERFEMEPKAQIDAMRRMREAGEQLFAIYHSHPHTPPVPSSTDLRDAAYPEALYLIISLNTQGVLEMRGYRLPGHQANEVKLEII